MGDNEINFLIIDCISNQIDKASSVDDFLSCLINISYCILQPSVSSVFIYSLPLKQSLVENALETQRSTIISDQVYLTIIFL